MGTMHIGTRALVPLIVCALFVSACGDGGGSSTSGSDPSGDQGGDSSTDPDSDPGGDLDSEAALGQRLVTPTAELQGSFKYFGYVDLVDDSVEQRVNYDANFLEMVDVQPASVFALSVPLAVDACSLRVTTSIPSDVGVIGFPDAPFELVSAGDTFTLTGEAGTHAVIERDAPRFDIAPYPLPEPLTLDVPGSVFPGFADVAVPLQTTVQDFRPSRNQTLGAGTTVTWTSSGVAGNSVYLRVFDFPASDRVVDLRCRMDDDGEFTLPDNVIAHLDATLGSGWSLDGAEQEQSAADVVIQGDALLVVSKRRDTL